jgi:hypothetical protein
VLSWLSILYTIYGLAKKKGVRSNPDLWCSVAGLVLLLVGWFWPGYVFILGAALREPLLKYRELAGV